MSKSAQTVRKVGAPSRPGRRRARTSLNLTPMIDVTFLLLIFFVVSTNFIREGVLKHELPRVGERGIILPALAIELVQAPGGQVALRVDGERVAMAGLYDRLVAKSRHTGLDAQMPVELRAGGSVSWQDVATVYNTLLRANLQNIRFDRGPAGML